MSIEKGCVIAGAYDEKSLKEKSSKRKVSAFNYPKKKKNVFLDMCNINKWVQGKSPNYLFPLQPKIAPLNCMSRVSFTFFVCSMSNQITEALNES